MEQREVYYIINETGAYEFMNEELYYERVNLGATNQESGTVQLHDVTVLTKRDEEPV